MAKRLTLSILAVITSLLCTGGSNLAVEDMGSIKISLLPEAESPLQVSDKDKPILRYGFHRTHDCQNFEKAFICVRKCLDLSYHIAHADKNCICTCYKNSVLAKYKFPINIDTASTKWKLGAPTTSRPAWAGGPVETKPKDYEINAKYTEFIEESTVEPEVTEDFTPDEYGHTGDEGSGYDETTTTEITTTPEPDTDTNNK